MKKFIKCLMIALIMPIAFLCCGCASDGNSTVSIKDIKKTDSVGIVDTYTVTYTNGQTSNFTVINGQDGANLYNNITINDLYNEVKDSKPAGYDIIDFIDEYLDIKIDVSAISSAKALRSAVSIFVEHEISITDYNNKISITETPFGSQITYGFKDSIACGAGAGVIYDLDTTTGDAYIITNYHVCFSTDVNAEDGIGTRFTAYVYGSETIDLTDIAYLSYYNKQNNNKTYYSNFEFDEKGLPIIDYGYGAIDAEYVGGSEVYDIAVLKVTGSEVLKDSDYLPVEVYDSDLVTAGSTAIAIGNPGMGGISTTNGVISVDSEYISVAISDSTVALREFRIDTPVNAGNSGGGLFDGFGSLIGIVNAKTADTTVYENMGYAIPGNIATRIADSIIDNCDGVKRKTSKFVMGIYSQVCDSKGYYDADSGLMRIKETVNISQFATNSLARECGFLVGDIITSVDIIKVDQTITIDIDRGFKLADALLLVREGDTVRFDCIRAGEEKTITMVSITSDNLVEVQ